MENGTNDFILNMFERALEIANKEMPTCFTCDDMCVNYGAVVQACADIAIKANETQFVNGNLNELIASCLH